MTRSPASPSRSRWPRWQPSESRRSGIDRASSQCRRGFRSALYWRSVILGASLPVLLAIAAPAQQQGQLPPDPQDSPLVQPAGVVQSHCPQPLAHVPPGSTVSSGDWVELQRTRCNGSCPVYTVRLYGNGTVQWTGGMFVAVRGGASGQVDAALSANLIQQLRDHGFNSLCGGYRRNITDAPSSLTTVSVAGNAFTVTDYANSAPAWLRDFDERIDALADTHRWRHGDPTRELFGPGNLDQDARLPKPGRTRLMRAAGTANGAIQLLLAQKVAVDAEDASGWTALMYAAGVGSLEQVRQLLAAGANAAHVSSAGETLLFAAAGSVDNPVAKLALLQKAGANVAAISNDGNTALTVAVGRYWQPEILKALLAMGASPSIRNSQGRTALDALDQARAKTDVPGAYEVARGLLLQAH